MIIAQQGLGTVLRQVMDDDNEEDSDDDDDESFVLGVTSVINMTELKVIHMVVSKMLYLHSNLILI